MEPEPALSTVKARQAFQSLIQRSKASSRRQHIVSEKVNVEAKNSAYSPETGALLQSSRCSSVIPASGISVRAWGGLLKQSLYRPEPEQEDKCTIPAELGMFLKSCTDFFLRLSRVGVRVAGKSNLFLPRAAVLSLKMLLSYSHGQGLQSPWLEIPWEIAPASF